MSDVLDCAPVLGMIWFARLPTKRSSYVYCLTEMMTSITCPGMFFSCIPFQFVYPQLCEDETSGQYILQHFHLTTLGMPYCLGQIRKTGKSLFYASTGGLRAHVACSGEHFLNKPESHFFRLNAIGDRQIGGKSILCLQSIQIPDKSLHGVFSSDRTNDFTSWHGFVYVPVVS